MAESNASNSNDSTEQSALSLEQRTPSPEQNDPSLEQHDHQTERTVVVALESKDATEASKSMVDSLIPPEPKVVSARTDWLSKEINIGQLLSWGCGEFGQHGHGHLEDVYPTQAYLENFYRFGGDRAQIKAISCGGSHTVVITELEEIYSWGNGNSGQLGCGNKQTRSDPTSVILDKDTTVSGIRGVCCGSRHTVYWLDNGQCYSSGNNFYAQLGYDFRIKNYKENQVLPHLLHPIIHKKIVQVACGEKHTLFRLDTGIIAGCGGNGFGQLGTGDRNEAVIPRVIEDVDDVTHVACGANHSLAVSGNGMLYVWGFGQPCGTRREDVLLPSRRFTRETNIISAAGSGSHSLALSANGTVYSWGGGSDGQLGHGEEVTYLQQPKPIARMAFLGRVSLIECGDAYSAAVTSNGTLHMWGRSSHVICPEKPPSWRVWRPQRVAIGSRRVGKLSCGSWHVIAVTGTPDWQPNEEESEEEDDDDDEVEEDSSGDDADDIRLVEETQRLSDDDDDENYINLPVSTSEIRSSRNTHHAASKLNLETVAEIRTIRMPREMTKLTLEEFYAATPLPEVAEVVLPGNDAIKQRCVSRGGEGFIREETSDEEKCEQGKEFQHRALTPLQDEPCSEVSSKMGKAETDVMMAREEEETSANPQGGLNKNERKSPLGELPDHCRAPRRKETSAPPPTHQHHPESIPPPPRPRMFARSRSMPVVPQRRASVDTARATIAPDWSTSSPSRDRRVPADQGSRFTIDRHVSLQMKRRGMTTNRSSSLPTTPERKATQMAQGSIKGVDHTTVAKSRSADQLYRETRRSQHPPKLKKFRSLSSQIYNPTKKKPGASGDQNISTLVSSIKLETRSDKIASGGGAPSPLGSPKGARQPAWGAAREVTTELSEVIPIDRLNNRTSKGPSSKYTRKPVFSSASSWRKRPEKSAEGGTLLGDLQPITNTATTLQKSSSSSSFVEKR